MSKKITLNTSYDSSNPSDVMAKFVKDRHAMKLSMMNDRETAAIIGATFPTMNDLQVTPVLSAFCAMAVSSTSALVAASLQWDSMVVMPFLMKIITSHSNPTARSNACTISAILVKRVWEQSHRFVFQDFLAKSSLTQECLDAIIRSAGQKYFRLPSPVVEKTAQVPRSNNHMMLDEASPSKRNTPSDFSDTPADNRKKIHIASPHLQPATCQLQAPPAHATEGVHLSDRRFDEFSLCEPTSRSLKEVLKYELMTFVQAATLPVIMQGEDVLARARTGTGKTLGFLIPSIELMYKNKPADNAVTVLVISPTRELSMQIAEETRKLTTHFPGFTTVVVMGGTSMPKETRQLANRVDCLVATPGRLQDHLSSDHKFAQRVRATLRTLVFDECDMLMSMGFSRDIDRIMSYMPANGQRQTLLFSATVKDEVRSLASKYCRTNFKFIDCVGDDAEVTHNHVTQSYVVIPFADQFAYLYKLLTTVETKAIVFFQTAKGTQLAANCMMEAGLGRTHTLLEIHSRRSQSQRTKAQQEFLQPIRGVLFSSDASARGVDYPGVELVVQIGAASDKDQYVHRLGRTARAGREGRGVLLIDPCEMFFISELGREIPVELDNTYVRNEQDIANVRAAMRKVSVSDRESSYQAWLGYMNSNLRRLGWNQTKVVANANEYAATTLHLDKQPALPAKTVGKMGLKGVPGILVEGQSGGYSRDNNSNTRGGRGGFGNNNNNNRGNFQNDHYNGNNNNQRDGGFESRGGPSNGSRGGRGGAFGGRGGRGGFNNYRNNNNN